MKKEKVLSVGEIKKSNSSYGNYIFIIEIQNPKFKTNKNIFAFGLKNIKKLREQYIKEVSK